MRGAWGRKPEVVYPTTVAMEGEWFVVLVVMVVSISRWQVLSLLTMLGGGTEPTVYINES